MLDMFEAFVGLFLVAVLGFAIFTGVLVARVERQQLFGALLIMGIGGLGITLSLFMIHTHTMAIAH